MTPGRAAVFGAVGLIVLATAATGTPLWTVPDRGSDQAQLGQGTADVSVQSVPDTATIDPGRQGGDVYYLRVPNARIAVSQLRGNPILTYSLRIDEIGYSTSSVNGLAGVGAGTAAVSIEQVPLDGTRLTQDRYDGELRLVLRGDDSEEVVYSGPIAVEVTA